MQNSYYNTTFFNNDFPSQMLHSIITYPQFNQYFIFHFKNVSLYCSKPPVTGLFSCFLKTNAFYGSKCDPMVFPLLPDRTSHMQHLLLHLVSIAGPHNFNSHSHILKLEYSLGNFSILMFYTSPFPEEVIQNLLSIRLLSCQCRKENKERKWWRCICFIQLPNTVLKE